jgi:hypothetical protein
VDGLNQSVRWRQRERKRERERERERETEREREYGDDDCNVHHDVIILTCLGRTRGDACVCGGGMPACVCLLARLGLAVSPIAVPLSCH